MKQLFALSSTQTVDFTILITEYAVQNLWFLQELFFFSQLKKE